MEAALAKMVGCMRCMYRIRKRMVDEKTRGDVMSEDARPDSATEADAPDKLLRVLGRFQLRWRFGLLAAGILRTLFWAICAILALGILDYFAGFGDLSRRVIGWFLILVGGTGAVLALW